MKYINAFLVVFFFINACASTVNKTSNDNPKAMIEFSEIRRLNNNIELQETTIVNNVKEITDIYNLLNEPNIRSSAPIPIFDAEKETMIVLKPKLKDHKYADIEILSVEYKNPKLTVTYKEVENWEFTENQWSDPIVIIQVNTKPKEIELIKN